MDGEERKGEEMRGDERKDRKKGRKKERKGETKLSRGERHMWSKGESKR